MMLCMYLLCCGSRLMTQDLQHGEIQDLYSKKNLDPYTIRALCSDSSLKRRPKCFVFFRQRMEKKKPPQATRLSLGSPQHIMKLLALPLNWHMINR